MTAQDANYLLGLAQANYGYAFKEMTKQQKIMLVNSWAFGLQDIPADIVMLAFMQLVTTSKWVPTVAEIREQVESIGAEAAENLNFWKNREWMLRELGREVPPHQEDENDAIRRYIVESTKHLRGYDGPGLKLDTILRCRSMTALGSGQMGFSELQGKNTNVLICDEEDYHV